MFMGPCSKCSWGHGSLLAENLWESEKEESIKVKEFSFEEVIARIKKGQTYKCTEDCWDIKSIFKDEYGFRIDSKYDRMSNKAKFTLVSEPVTFMEAVQALNKNKKVYCMINNSRYDFRINGAGVPLDGDGAVNIKQILEGVWFIDED